jgi:hypothetical protein
MAKQPFPTWVGLLAAWWDCWRRGGTHPELLVD